MPFAVSRNSALSVLETYCSAVPGIATSTGGPTVTMISAGLVLTKMVGEVSALAG